MYNAICSEQYSDYTRIFTDGSKRKEGVGAAVVWSGGRRIATLPNEASIFSAEAHAIGMAVRLAESLEGPRFVIVTDSCSVLRLLMNVRNNHPVCRHVLHNISALRGNNKNVKLLWIPSHVGISGNEEADRLAVAATSKTEEYIPIHYRDWYPKIQGAIEEAWNEKWREVNQKMFEVKESAGEWKK